MYFRNINKTNFSLFSSNRSLRENAKDKEILSCARIECPENCLNEKNALGRKKSQNSRSNLDATFSFLIYIFKLIKRYNNFSFCDFDYQD